ncbi:MAG TPA: hypothetical protein VLQ79_12235, partial [Myxococcaceae bacterium]|nr:hypothetical protein [Myxococcaceae bacterium]
KFWIYVVGPLVGMNLGALLATSSRAHLACPKLAHPATQRCIFCGHVPPETVSLATFERR